MKIPKYYLKPFWQANRLNKANGSSFPATVWGVSKNSYNKTRLMNEKPVLYSNTYTVDNFGFPDWALTKRLEMEEKKG